MARSDSGAASLRIPGHVRRRSSGEPPAQVEDQVPRMRLVVTKGKLGVELDQPFELGPLTLEQLALSLPQVSFPVELSGGVAAFRNKRGELERVVVSLSGKRLQAWARPRLSGLLPGRLHHHLLAPLEDGWLVGITGDASALAFTVRVAPNDDDLRLIPTEARGIGLGAPPAALATRALFALLKPHGRLVGGAVVVEGGARLLATAVAPLAGMRVPETRGLVVSWLTAEVEGMTLAAEREAAPFATGERAQRAVELASLTHDAEAALLASRVDDARRHYVAALALAPRHPGIARRLAELDRAAGDRAEAGLAVISDSLPVVEAGILGAQLLAAVGDHAGARAALERAAREEPYGPLAGLCWLELAALAELDEAPAFLDEAVGRAPGLAAARWARFDAALRQGRLRDARGDLQHLEAEAAGASERHDVLRRAAHRYLAHHLREEAAAAFERSLRYRPDSVEAVAGLARALQSANHRRRALELFARATSLAERGRQTAHRVTLDYASALVEVADDRPAAIARVQGIPSFHPAAFEARLLEARWRVEIGDLAGAGVALARLAESVEAALGVLVGERLPQGELAGFYQARLARDGEAEPFFASPREARARVAALLEEGARYAELDRNDRPAARRLLTLALRLAPQDARIGRAFRRLAEAMDRGPEPGAGRPAHEAASLAPERAEDPLDDTLDRPPPDDALLETTDDAPRIDEPPMSFSQTLQDVLVADTLEMPVLPPSSRAVSQDGPPMEGAPPLAARIESPPPLDLDALTMGAADDDEVLAEQLAERLRANPDDEETANALVGALERLGRDHDLLALISARFEETHGLAREGWGRRRQQVLARLAARARAAGRIDEAELYELMLRRD